MKSSPMFCLPIRFGILLLLLAALSGCSSVYVDGTTKEIPATNFRHVEPVHPVQLLFEFQTNGVTNAVATDFLKQSVIEQVDSSGLFSKTSEEPVPGGAVLGITLNNVAVDDEAFSKGFVAGLTFGLAGTQVSDGYICTATYNNGTNNQAITTRARHAIHTTVGASKAPDNATKAASLDEAVKLMSRQILSNVLNNLSNDIAFQ